MPQIPLHNRAGDIVAYTVVDAEDAALADRRWFRSDDGYAVRNRSTAEGRGLLRMHRAILGLSLRDGLQADHINGDRLDNRRANLRVVTQAENAQNRSSRRGARSRFRGVTWDSRAGKWHARVKISGHRYDLGRFALESDAAAAARAFRLERLPLTNEDREHRCD